MSLRAHLAPILPNGLFMDGSSSYEKRDEQYMRSPTLSSPPSYYAGSVYGSENYAHQEPYIVNEHNFIPALPVTYVFTPTSTLSTALVAPGAHAPLATIDVSSDCFAPDLVKTKIVGGDQKEVIGEFEMGTKRRFSNVTLHGVTKRMTDVVGRRGCGKWKPRFSWNFDNNPRHEFFWTYRADGTAFCTRERIRKRCSAPPPLRPLAILHGRNIERGCCGSREKNVSNQGTTTLELSPEAHASGLLEHILLSAVLVERQRLARFGDNKRRS